MEKLTLCSYNVHGYNVTKKDYISHLLATSSFLFLQEHWLNNAQLNTFSNAFPGYCIHGVSAIDSSVLLRGRPHGGVFFFFFFFFFSVCLFPISGGPNTDVSQHSGEDKYR